MSQNTQAPSGAPTRFHGEAPHIPAGAPMPHGPFAGHAPASGTLPTVRVVAADAPGATCVINVSDFDPALHTLAGESVRVVHKNRPAVVTRIATTDFDPRAHKLVGDQPHA